MPEACTLYVPLRMFPSREQLVPLCPDARVSVDWAAATATVEWPAVRVRLSRMPEQELGRHLEEFIRWARSAGGTEALAIRILHTLAVWGATIEPGASSERHASQFLMRLNSAADGLLFSGGEIYDACGEPLLRSGGPLPPNADRVMRRALALLAISVRGLLEDDAGKPDHARADDLRQELLAWLQSRGLLEELEPDERALMEAPLGTPARQAIVDAVWRAEGAQLLLWALGARPLPDHDAQEHPYGVAREAGLLGEALPPPLASPCLRSPEELQAQRRRLPPVIEMARRRLQERGLLERVDLVAGDFYRDELPGDHDVALLSAIIHQNGSGRAGSS